MKNLLARAAALLLALALCGPALAESTGTDLATDTELATIADLSTATDATRTDAVAPADEPPAEPAEDTRPRDAATGVFYETADGAARVTDLEEGRTWLWVPDEADGAPVTAVAEGALRGRADVTAVTLPLGVTEIGAEAFAGCGALTDVYFGGTADEFLAIAVGDGNEALTGAVLHPETLGEGVCGENVSWRLTADGTFTLEGSGEMASYTYASCPWSGGRRAIRRVAAGEGITTVGTAAFYGCPALTEVDLPAGLTQIGDQAFNYCTALERIELPEGVVRVGFAAFQGDGALREVSLPAGLAVIDKAAFNNCRALTDVHYAGSKEAFSGIYIDGFNDPVLNAEKHFSE